MNSYTSPVDKLLTYGSPDHGDLDQWPDYLALDLTTAQIPELLRMVNDRELLATDCAVSVACWAPLHAMRALGQLRDIGALEPLLTASELLLDDDEGLGDWSLEELPEVYALFGPQAIPVLATALAVPSRELYVRSCIGRGLAKIGQQHPEQRLACIEALSGFLETSRERASELNGFIVSDLLELKAVEAASVIEAAIEAGFVDTMITGDWDDVQVDLGLKSPSSSSAQSLSSSVVSSPPLSGAGRYAVRPRRLASNAMSKKDKAKMSKVSRKKNKRRRKGV